MNIHNNTKNDLGSFIEIIEKFIPFAQKQIGFNRPPTINLMSDTQNATNLLGKTAYYDPSQMEIVVYTDNRHPKDMLRSISHELVHHAQNCNGEFADALPMSEDYAQNDPHLRKMEEDANQRGNMCVRDFVDQKIHLKESKRRNFKMIDEKHLRLAVHKLIRENMENSQIKEALSPKEAYQILLSSLLDGEDESALQGVSLSSVEGGPDASKWRGDEDPDVVAGLADVGHERLPGTAALETSPWRGSNKAKNAAEKAAAGDAEAEEEVEVIELSEDMLGSVINEARRRRRRRRARILAQQGTKAVPEVADDTDKKVKAVEGPKKVVIAKKVQKDLQEKEVKQVKPIKEWYEEELFGRLLKEVIK